MPLFRPQPGLPFTPYALADGRKSRVSTTLTSQQVDLDVRHRVVQALTRLIRFSNEHPAFNGDCVVNAGGSAVTMTWTSGDAMARLEADVALANATGTWTVGGYRRTAAWLTCPARAHPRPVVRRVYQDTRRRRLTLEAPGAVRG